MIATGKGEAYERHPVLESSRKSQLLTGTVVCPTTDESTGQGSGDRKYSLPEQRLWTKRMKRKRRFNTQKGYHHHSPSSMILCGRTVVGLLRVEMWLEGRTIQVAIAENC